MKNTRWKPFSYLLIDRSAAQAKLNQWAQEGWALERVYCGLFAKLKPTNRADLTYFLDWTDPQCQDGEDYLQLCADGGWELVDTVDYLNIFASRPGMDPVPIQTDPELEYLRFRKKVLRRMALGAVLASVFLVLCAVAVALALTGGTRYLPMETRQGYLPRTLLQMVCASPTFFCIAVLLPFYCLGALAYSVLLLRQLLRWKRALRNGEAFPTLGPKASRIWSVLHMAGMLACDLLFPFMLWDTLANGFLSPGTAIGALVGIAIALATRWEHIRLRRRAMAWGACALCLLACCLCHGPFRSAYQGRIPPPPPLSHLGAQPPQATWQRDGFLGSIAQWEYDVTLEEGQTGSRYTTVYLDAETYATSALTQAAQEPLSAHLTPSEVQGLWTGEDAMVLRQGNTQLTARFFNPALSAPVLTLLQTWMSALEP